MDTTLTKTASDMAMFLPGGSEKGFAAFAKRLGGYAAFGAALGIAGHAINEGASYLKESRRKSRMAPLYSEMMNLHPKLKGFDPARVKLFYEQLWHFSPKVAENPLAAGNYVYYAMQYDQTAGGPGITAFKELTDIEEKHKKIKGDSFSLADSISGSATIVDQAGKDPFYPSFITKNSSDRSRIPIDPITGSAMVKRSI